MSGQHLGDRVTAGIAWLSLQTVFSKLITFAGQIVLARLLVPEDFGAIGLAYTVTAFTSLLQQAGVREVLLSRGNRFHLWAAPAGWIAIVSGLATGLLLLLIAPVAARVYSVPQLVGLLSVLAFNSPIEAMQVVPDAALRFQLRFRPLAAMHVLRAAGVMALSIMCAWRGMGAYSFVLPVPIVGFLSMVALWTIAGPLRSWRPRLRKWRFLLADSGYVVAATFLYLTVTQGDYFLLGVFYTQQVVGLYFFAYQMSMQTVSTISFQFLNTLFPALSHLKAEPERQLRAFLRAQRILALIVIPVCLLQVPLAGPLVRLVFQPKWYPSILLIQILSVGMMFRTLAMTHAALIQAQGRFRTRFLLSAASAVGFCAIAIPATFFWQEVGMAVAVAIYSTAVTPVNLLVSIRPAGGRFADIVDMIRMPLPVSVLAISVAALSASLVPTFYGADGVRALVVLAVSSLIYLPLIKRLAPVDFGELTDRLRTLLLRVGA